MNILERMKVADIDRRYRRPEDPKAASLAIEEVESSFAPKHNGFNFEQAYTTRVTIETTWYANGAQYDGRRKIAHRELIEMIYGPVLARLNRILARAMDRDYEGVIEQVTCHP